MLRLRLCVFGVCTLMIAIQTESKVKGSFIFDVEQVPQGVAVTGNGTLNITSLTPTRTGVSSGSYIIAMFGQLGAGPVSGIPNIPFAQYSGFVGPTAFGTGSEFDASSGSGDTVAVGDGSLLVVPVGYVSGAELSDVALFSSRTFSSLGLTQGVYAYTWGSGPTADSLTINIGVVPEPTSVAIAGFSVTLAARRRRRRFE